ncbi:MAG: serine protease [Paracoccaceae bacterium]
MQLEAHLSPATAEQAAREYDVELDNVAGLTIGGGWYSVALGPFETDEAQRLLAELRAQGRIPRDRVMGDPASTASSRSRAGTARRPPSTRTAPHPARSGAEAPAPQPAPQPAPAEVVAENPAPEPEPEPVVVPQPELPEETPAEARRSEAQLTRDERAELQIALQWFGYYRGGIDAAFGPGTRGSMAAYQADIGAEQTGVLTTRQRARLLSEYNEILSSIGFQTVRDETAGIQIDLPLAMVSFDRYDPPFAHYVTANDSGVRVLLISQAGDEATLLGLYDIMQTLKIVPLDGERERRRGSFILTGENADITSYTYAVLANGHVKGFTLIWPAGEDRRREVVLERMRDSFTPLAEFVLPETVGEGALDQSIDLLSGLEIRRPERARSGFYVDARGTVLTTAEAVASCDQVTIDEAYTANVVAVDDDLGLALLRPRDPLAPMGFARFTAGVPRIASEIAVAGRAFEARSRDDDHLRRWRILRGGKARKNSSA